MDAVDKKNGAGREYKVNDIGDRIETARFKMPAIVQSLVVASIIGVCSQVSQDGKTTPTQSIKRPTLELAPTHGRIHLGFDGKNWMTSGHYPEDFVLKVYAGYDVEKVDGKVSMIESSEVLAAQRLVSAGYFDMQDYVGSDDAVFIHIEAEKNDNSGESIAISSDPGQNGFYGITTVFNIDHEQIKETDCENY